MTSHAAEEDNKQRTSRTITERKARILWADLEAGTSATLELSFLRLIIQSCVSAAEGAFCKNRCSV